jgi:tetratricopeptide (TPR) repeat protein
MKELYISRIFLALSSARVLIPVAMTVLLLPAGASAEVPLPGGGPAVTPTAPARVVTPLPIQVSSPAAASNSGKTAVPSNAIPVKATVPVKAAAPAKSRADQEWAALQKAGSEAIENGQYGVAERTLKQAIIKGVVFGDRDLRYARSLDELGRLYTIRGRFGEAEPLLEEALHVKELAIDDESGKIIPSLGHMISFYLENGTASKAAPLADQLLSFVEGRINESRERAAGPVTLKKGQPLTGWAGQAAPSMRDPIIEWAITCDAIGNQFRAKGDYDMADRLFKAALDVKETVLGKEHLSLANSFESIGTICLDKNEDSEAENMYRYALEHTERVLPDDYGKIFPRIDKLAKCLIKEKKYEEAEALYIRSLDFWKKEPSRNGSEARLNFALGNVYVLEKKYDAAVPVLKEALRLAEEYYGPNSISLLPYLQRNADLMYYMGQNEQRIQFKSRADTIAGVTGTVPQ